VREPTGKGRSIARENDFAQMALDHLAGEVGDDRAFEILSRGLELGRAHEVPEDAVGFELFAQGVLYDAMREHLGTTRASSVANALSEGAVDLAESGIRYAGSSHPPSVGGGKLRKLVVVVSTDLARASRVVARLRGRVDVFEARDVFTLMKLAETQLDRKLAILIDGNVPGLRGPMLMTLSRALPPSAEVIFWGGTPPLESRLRLVVLPSMSTAEEVAERCVGAEGVAADAGERRGAIATEPAPPRMVVVADPDPVDLTTLEVCLSAEGFDVIACQDGFAALEACIDNRVGLVVSALEMPVIDGVQLASLLVGRFGPDAPPLLLRTARPRSQWGARLGVREGALPVGVLSVVDTSTGEDLDAILAELRRLLPTALLSR
jgi:CheY-like chemotaxis protein